MSDDELRAHGWHRSDDGVWRRPSAVAPHRHSAICTVESCGETAVFFCAGDRCLRALRQGQEKACGGHRLFTREQLVAYSLRKRGLTKPSPAGTPLEEDEATNTWSDER